MTIEKKINGEEVILTVSGRLDTQTAPELENELDATLPGIKELVFDMTNLEYISSAGIRVLLGAYKKMSMNQGTMRIEKASDMVREVFEMTGLSQMVE